MKKTGFTLAEVLITLAIIGFIASITLPSLNASTGERQAAVALKKSINSLTNAAQLSQVLDSVDLGAITTYDEFSNVVTRRMNAEASIGGDNRAVFLLRDGTSLITGTDANSFKNTPQLENDNLPHGFNVIIDTNGNKPPNKESECADDDCSSSRKIYDRFSVMVRGNMVVPSNSATRWLIAQ